MNRIAAVVTGLSLAFVGTSATFATTINVPGDQPTIAAAINAAVTGDVINIAAGTYNEADLNPGGKAITIQGTINGDGSLATIIDAQGVGRVFVMDTGEGAETVIQNLAMTGGLVTNSGGAIRCLGTSPTISNCTITGNTSLNGGGIWSSGGNPSIIDCTISGNTADNVGGGILCESDSSPTISNCTITGNTSFNGGGIWSRGGNPSIIDCTISGNTAGDGGGIYLDNSNCTISGCTISGNVSELYFGEGGGGIYIVPNSNATIASTLFCGNDPDDIAGNYTDVGGNTFQGACPSICCTNGHCVTAEDGATQSECLKYFGQWFEVGDCNDCSPHLAGDLDGDGDVDANDLDSLHSSLSICPHDIDHDGDTDIDDLLRFLAGYGATCP